MRDEQVITDFIGYEIKLNRKECNMNVGEIREWIDGLEDDVEIRLTDDSLGGDTEILNFTLAEEYAVLHIDSETDAHLDSIVSDFVENLKNWK